ncbi:MAG: hypothetical protein ABIF40_01285 [archaeon]
MAKRKSPPPTIDRNPKKFRKKAFADSSLDQYEYETVADFSNLLGVRLDATEEVAKLLLMQTLCGHSEQGHGMYKIPYPNSNFHTITEALHKGNAINCTPKQVMQKRQKQIDIFNLFLDDIITGKKVSKFKVGQNILFGAYPLADIEISGNKGRQAVLTGMYLGACMDNFNWREKVEEVYGIKMGGGYCLPIDLVKLNNENLDLKDLASYEWSEDDISKMRDKGIVPEVPMDGLATTENVVLGYIRRKFGRGISDDLAIICSGLVYKWHYKLRAGLEPAAGVYCLDAIDTFDKFTPLMCEGGQDEHVATVLEERLPEIQQQYPSFKLPTEKEVIDFMATIALDYDKDSGLAYKVGDNSQRYLLQMNGEKPLSPLRSYFKFLRGRKTHKVRVGYRGSNVLNTKLQQEAQRRVDKMYGSN